MFTGICSVFILYNPNLGLLESNVKLAASSTKRVLLFDNSSDPLPQPFLHKIKQENVEYKFNNGNAGIAAALNAGLKWAESYGYSHLLTMDQDSQFPIEFVQASTSFLRKDTAKLGVLCPNLIPFKGAMRSQMKTKTSPLSYALSSGSIMNVDVCVTLGGFQNKFFIDGVDQEICFNLRKNGYEIVQINNVYMQHNLGNNAREIKLLGRHLFNVLNESSFRYYYMYRNYLEICKMYRESLPQDCRELKTSLVKTFIKMLLFEPDKCSKIRFAIKGIIDYTKGKFGQLK